MSRPLRIEFAGALYHITSRGNERNAIYRQDADRLLFFEVLEEVCRRYHLRITGSVRLGNAASLSGWDAHLGNR